MQLFPAAIQPVALQTGRSETTLTAVSLSDRLKESWTPPMAAREEGRGREVDFFDGGLRG